MSSCASSAVRKCTASMRRSVRTRPRPGPRVSGMAGWKRGSRWMRSGHLGTEADRATFRTLHTASLAAPALRSGLTHTSAEKSVKHLRTLLGTPSVVLTDCADVLAWDGAFEHHRELA